MQGADWRGVIYVLERRARIVEDSVSRTKFL